MYGFVSTPTGFVRFADFRIGADWIDAYPATDEDRAIMRQILDRADQDAVSRLLAV